MSGAGQGGDRMKPSAPSVVRWGVGLTLLWLPLWWRLSEVWRFDPEMRHGWLVPPLLAYFAWDRRRFVPGANPVAPRLWLGLFALAFTLAGLGYWIWGANPEWPRLMWFITAMLGGATLSLAGWGGGTRWAGHWAGVVGLAFFALPWPTMIQHPLTLGLASLNAHIAAEVVSAMGFPAAVHGRVIEVGAGLAGVEEACSGIRSLQTVTMVAVFLAVFFRLGWKRGLGVLAAGWAVAMAGNLMRTCYLILVLAREGEAAMDAVHDTAGNVVLWATLAAMSVIAWWMPEGPLPPRSQPHAGVVVPRLNRRSLVVLAVAIGVVEICIWQWYAGGGLRSDRVGWTWTERDDWQPRRVPVRAQEMLGYSEGEGRFWSGQADRPSVLAYLFRWEGDLSHMRGAEFHDPTVCLPSIGSTLVRELPVLKREYPGGGIKLSGYHFHTPRGRSQFVFFQVWDATTATEVEWRDRTMWDRWQRVWDRRGRGELFQLFVVLEAELAPAEASRIAAQAFQEIMVPQIES